MVGVFSLLLNTYQRDLTRFHRTLGLKETLESGQERLSIQFSHRPAGGRKRETSPSCQCSVEHGVLVVDVPALLLDLPLPLVLLLAHLVEHAAARATSALLVHRKGLLQVELFVNVLLVGGGSSLAPVEQRVEAHEEQHVDRKQGDDPDDEDDQHPDGGGVAALVAALAARTELTLPALDVIRLGQDHPFAVASLWRYIHDVELAIGLGALDHCSARTDALAAHILVLRLTTRGERKVHMNTDRDTETACGMNGQCERVLFN